MINADLAESSAVCYHSDHVTEYDSFISMSSSIDGLHTYAIHSSRDPRPVVTCLQRSNVDDRIMFGKGHGNGADALCNVEAARRPLYGLDSRGTAQNRRVGGQQTNRAGSEDSDGVAGLEIRIRQALPTRNCLDSSASRLY